MTMHIHYRTTDGEIVGYETGTINPKCIDDCAILSDDQAADLPNHLNQKIDLVSLKLVEKSDVEKQQALAPRINQVSALVSSELRATDCFMASDFPVSGDQATQWKTYRQALRDLSKGKPSIADMIKAFPVRPDGADAAAGLRPRIAKTAAG